MREVRRWYLIPRRYLEDLATPAVLDMLRYDGARVEGNAPAGFYMLSNKTGPAVARWASFGVRGIHGPYDAEFEARDGARPHFSATNKPFIFDPECRGCVAAREAEERIHR